MQQPHTARPSLRFSIYLRLLHAQGLRPGHPLAFESTVRSMLFFEIRELITPFYSRFNKTWNFKHLSPASPPRALARTSARFPILPCVDPPAASTPMPIPEESQKSFVLSLYSLCTLD